jgi:hypothetical protein
VQLFGFNDALSGSIRLRAWRAGVADYNSHYIHAHILNQDFRFGLLATSDYTPNCLRWRMVQELKCGRCNMLRAAPESQFWAYGTPLA